MDVTRRQFLKILGISGAAVALPSTAKDIVGDIWAYPDFNPERQLRNAVRFSIKRPTSMPINKQLEIALEHLEEWVKATIPVKYRKRVAYNYKFFDYQYFNPEMQLELGIVVIYTPIGYTLSNYEKDELINAII